MKAIQKLTTSSSFTLGNSSELDCSRLITTFKHSQFGEIRCMTDDRGEPWFVGKDVAEKLGYKNVSKALLDHVEDEDKLNNETLSSLGQRGGWLINESGLYALILSSKLPQAKAFKKWVTGTVLPQIRKTGGYIPVDKNDDSNDILRKAIKIYENTVSLQSEMISELQPKALYYEKVLSSPSTYTMTQLAKELSMTVFQLQEALVKMHIIYRQSHVFMLYKDYLHKGYEAYRTRHHDDLFGNVEWTNTYLVWTEKGKEFVHRLLSPLTPQGGNL